jgi:hypothetical protein
MSQNDIWNEMIRRLTVKKAFIWRASASRSLTMAAIWDVRARRCALSRRYSVERACFCIGYIFQERVSTRPGQRKFSREEWIGVIACATKPLHFIPFVATHQKGKGTTNLWIAFAQNFNFSILRFIHQKFMRLASTRRRHEFAR